MDYILETNGLTKTYGKHNAANNISIHVRQGDIYGLIGRNGAGKTTLLKMVSGLSNPTAGEFTLFGYSSKARIPVMHRIGSQTLQGAVRIAVGDENFIDGAAGSQSLGQGIAAFQLAFYFLNFRLALSKTVSAALGTALSRSAVLVFAAVTTIFVHMISTPQ